MARYTVVKFNDKYAVKKVTLGIFTSYVDLTQGNTYWMCWGKGEICFDNCLNTKERAFYVFGLTTEGEEV